jgi:hypothetical protein
MGKLLPTCATLGFHTPNKMQIRGDIDLHMKVASMFH